MPLLARQEDEAEEQHQDLEIASGAAAAEPEAAAAPQQGDLEQGLIAAGSEAGGSNRAEDEAAYEVSRFTMPWPMHAD